MKAVLAQLSKVNYRTQQPDTIVTYELRLNQVAVN